MISRWMWLVAIGAAALGCVSPPLADGAPAPGPTTMVTGTAEPTDPAIQGLDRLPPDEQAQARRNLERWRSMTPEERQRVMENYRHWRGLTSDERRAAREGLQRLDALPPSERARIFQDFQRWNELPDSRKRELDGAYERFQRMAPDRQQEILQRFNQYQALPLPQRERIERNWQRWRVMTPEERQRARDLLKERQDPTAGAEPSTRPGDVPRLVPGASRIQRPSSGSLVPATPPPTGATQPVKPPTYTRPAAPVPQTTPAR